MKFFCCLYVEYSQNLFLGSLLVQQEVMLARQTASVQQGGIRLSVPIIVHFLATRSRGGEREELGEVPYIRLTTILGEGTFPTANMSVNAKRDVVSYKYTLCNLTFQIHIKENLIQSYPTYPSST